MFFLVGLLDLACLSGLVCFLVLLGLCLMLFLCSFFLSWAFFMFLMSVSQFCSISGYSYNPNDIFIGVYISYIVNILGSPSLNFTLSPGLN